MRWLLIGIVWLYFLVLLVGPILYMASQSFSEGLAAFWAEISRPEALHGFTLTAEIALIVLVLNVIFGTMTAMVLARQKFWGRSLVSGVIGLVPSACARSSASPAWIALTARNITETGYEIWR